MAARPSMQHLIARLRLWIADPSGAGEALTDEQLQDHLDGNRVDETRAELTVRSAPAGGGGETVTARAARGWWEDGAVLQGGDGTIITPDDADLARGVWTLATAPDEATVTGARYDLHGAAADALTGLLAALRGATDWSDGQIRVRRDGTLASLRELAADHRRRSERGEVRSLRMRRSDQVAAR